MAKSYFQNGNFIIPFAHITTTMESTDPYYKIEIYTSAGKYYGIFEEQVEHFIPTYTAWLNSKDNNIL